MNTRTSLFKWIFISLLVLAASPLPSFAHALDNATGNETFAACTPPLSHCLPDRAIERLGCNVARAEACRLNAHCASCPAGALEKAAEAFEKMMPEERAAVVARLRDEGLEDYVRRWMAVRFRFTKRCA